MKKIVMNRDRKFSIGILIFSVLMMWQTSQINATYMNVDGSDPGSKLFPYMTAILLFICAIGKFITCNEPDEKEFAGGKTGYFRIAEVLIVLLLYAVLLDKIGFILVSFLSAFILLNMMKLNRKVKWYGAVIFAAILTAALYILFQKVLQVNLPVGSLWKAIL